MMSLLKFIHVLVRLRVILAISLLVSLTTAYAQLLTQSLRGNYVKSFCAEDSSKLLIATEKGLWRFDGKKAAQVPIRVSGTLLPPQNLEDVIINDKVIWAASRQNGLFVKPGSDWVHINSSHGAPQAPISDLLVDSFGRIWIGTEGEGTIIFVKGDSSWHRITKTCYEVFEGGSWVSRAKLNHSIIGERSFNDIRVIEEGTNGAIWLGNEGGLVRFSSGSGIIDSAAVTKSVHWQDFLVGKHIRSLEFDRGGNAWAGTSDRGVFRLGLNGSVDEPFRKGNSPLGTDTVPAIELDMDGILWFGTDIGVCRFNPEAKSSINQWRCMGEKQHPSFKVGVEAVFNDSDNNLWFGLTTDQGMLRLNNNWFTFDMDSLEVSPFVSALLLNKEEIWVGTTKGIVRLRGEDPVQTIKPGSYNQISSLAPAKNSQVWVGVFGGGVFLYDENGIKRCFLDEKGIPDKMGNRLIDTLKKVTQIIERNNEVWIATLAGLSRFSLLDSSWTNYIATPGELISNEISSLAFDDSGKLWCGTAEGVSVLNPNSGKWEPPLTTDNGLSNNVVTTIASHPTKNEMWLGTDGDGISIYNDTGWQPKVLADNVINQIVFSQNGNEVWVATPGGVSRRDANGVWGAFSTQSGLANDFVQSIALQGDSLRWFGTWGSGLTRYRPPQSHPETFIDSRLDVTDKSEVTYHFSAADLNTAQNEFRFQYWIDTQKPSEPTADRFAVVPIPKPVTGPHTFYVRAIDRDGHYDREAARDYFYRIDRNFGGWTSQELDVGTVRLYIPPTVLSEQGVAIMPVNLEELDDPLVILAFDVSLLPQGSTFKFKKPVTMQVILKNRRESEKKELAIFRKDTLSSWIGIGGTVESRADNTISITTAITEPGRYAVRKDRGFNGEPLTNEVNIQPRIFSPAGRGRGYGDRTSISFPLKKESMVTIKIYNLSGRLVRALCENRSMNPGRNVIEWNGRDYNAAICLSGLYVVTIEAAEMLATKTVMVFNE